jgi:hypothetical protein
MHGETVKNSKVSFPLQDICMSEGVASANEHAREGTLFGDVCPCEIRRTSQKPARVLRTDTCVRRLCQTHMDAMHLSTAEHLRSP